MIRQQNKREREREQREYDRERQMVEFIKEGG
jgi:hypothetical protein